MLRHAVPCPHVNAKHTRQLQRISCHAIGCHAVTCCVPLHHAVARYAEAFTHRQGEETPAAEELPCHAGSCWDLLWHAASCCGKLRHAVAHSNHAVALHMSHSGSQRGVWVHVKFTMLHPSLTARQTRQLEAKRSPMRASGTVSFRVMYSMPSRWQYPI
jgi:hypothetical protein